MRKTAGKIRDGQPESFRVSDSAPEMILPNSEMARPEILLLLLESDGKFRLKSRLYAPGQ
jgi:hypothetical protein